eukprot:2230555-Pleurochrysis_carterae.AAC.5
MVVGGLRAARIGATLCALLRNVPAVFALLLGAISAMRNGVLCAAPCGAFLRAAKFAERAAAAAAAHGATSLTRSRATCAAPPASRGAL